MPSNSDVAATFRAKVNFMKNFKPASTISNRDRLELYALHKQAVSGDAPPVMASANGAERAKYQAWRSKSGLSPETAMNLYLQESDRQIRVYGSANSNSNSNQSGESTNNSSPTNNSQNSNNNFDDTPRGLAAIPLLCAAAAESRGAYLRRLSQTPLEAAWWGRQEPLCCNSLGSSKLAVWPEVSVIFLARLVETWTLTTGSRIVAALLWPLHNALLGLWILAICLLTLGGSALQIIQILIWGSRRTGISLQHVWKEQIGLLLVNIDRTCEPHQALGCRLVGLTLLPVTYAIQILNQVLPSMTLAGSSFVVLLGITWWYWLLVVPWLAFLMLGTALMSGFCFALIEFAGV